MSISRRELGQLVIVVLVGFAAAMLLRTSVPIGTDVRDRSGVQAIREDRSSPVAERSAADVTVIIFGDFRCPACRKAHPELKRAIENDRHVRVVFKDWPIFGPISERAARVAIASNYQGIYPAVYDNFMSSGQFDESGLRNGVEQAGGHWDRLKIDLQKHGADIDRQLANNGGQALELGLAGTPGYLIGPILIRGAATTRQFSKVIDQARQLQ